MAISMSLETLRNKKASAQDRAVALCWVLHLVGDLHQPLHAANRVTKQKPRGEGLGGDFIVLGPDKKRINMHNFWDQLPGVDPSYKAITKLANELTSTPELKPPTALKEYRENQTLSSWVQESFRLAVDFAYAEDRLQFVYEGDLESGKVTAAAIPSLRDDYVTEARKIAHRRLVLAAQRLVDELKEVW
jgi:hypothetical protein